MNLEDESLQPDVDWTVVEHSGFVILTVQTESETLTALLLARNYENVKVRFLFDNEQLPALVPGKFAVYVDDDFANPILTTVPDEYLQPLRQAVSDKAEWVLNLQVVVEGSQYRKMVRITPDGAAETLKTDDGGELLPGWIVGMY